MCIRDRYSEIEHPDVRLPERVHGEGYGRKPIPEQMFVPECY